MGGWFLVDLMVCFDFVGFLLVFFLLVWFELIVGKRVVSWVWIELLEVGDVEDWMVSLFDWSFLLFILWFLLFGWLIEIDVEFIWGIIFFVKLGFKLFKIFKVFVVVW